MNARAGAAYHGCYPRVDFEVVDLLEEDTTATLVSRLKPLVIVNCSTLLSWWASHQAPRDLARDLDRAGFGPWLPMHLTLARKLMRAVQRAGVEVNVINSSFPDVVNPVLARVGMAPRCGLGNFDLLYPELQRVAGERLGINPAEVSVYMIMHHFHTSFFREYSRGAGPYHVSLYVGGRSVGEDWDMDELLHEASKTRMGAAEINSVVASSGLRIAVAMLENSGRLCHTPGPNGLPGGYPVRVYADEINLALPEGVSYNDALAINEAAQRRGGIELIEDDGTVVFTEEAARIMREELGYDCPELAPGEDLERARELNRLFKRAIREGG